MCKKLSFSTDVYVIFCYWKISMKCKHFIFICHLLMLTYFLCGKYSTISITAFDYLLMLTYFSCSKCSYHSWLMFMWFSVTGTYQWSGWTSSSFVIDIFFVWKVFYDFNTAFDYLLMLTYFSCAKCSYHSRLIFMWFSVTETYQWSARTLCWFFIYWCWNIFCVENILEFQYCFWLFTDVDYFSCAKCSYHSRLMFMWVSVTETYQWSAHTSSWFVIY